MTVRELVRCATEFNSVPEFMAKQADAIDTSIAADKAEIERLREAITAMAKRMDCGCRPEITGCRTPLCNRLKSKEVAALLDNPPKGGE
jgi:hypothetical protein